MGKHAVTAISLTAALALGLTAARSAWLPSRASAAPACTVVTRAEHHHAAGPHVVCNGADALTLGRGQTLRVTSADLMPGEQRTSPLTVTNTTARAVDLYIAWTRPRLTPAPSPIQRQALRVRFGGVASFDAASRGGIYKVPGGLPRGATRDLSLSVALASAATNEWQGKTVRFSYAFIATR